MINEILLYLKYIFIRYIQTNISLSNCYLGRKYWSNHTAIIKSGVITSPVGYVWVVVGPAPVFCLRLGVTLLLFGRTWITQCLRSRDVNWTPGSPWWNGEFQGWIWMGSDSRTFPHLYPPSNPAVTLFLILFLEMQQASQNPCRTLCYLLIQIFLINRTSWHPCPITWN